MCTAVLENGHVQMVREPYLEPRLTKGSAATRGKSFDGFNSVGSRNSVYDGGC